MELVSLLSAGKTLYDLAQFNVACKSLRNGAAAAHRGCSERGRRPRPISFKDPDAVIVIDTIDHRAGIALWTRDDLKHHRLLRPDYPRILASRQPARVTRTRQGGG